MQNVTVIQAYAYSDVIKRVVELTRQGYEVDYSARVYPRIVGNKYVVTMGLPEQGAIVEQRVDDVVVAQDAQHQEQEKKPTRAKKKTVESGEND